MVVSGLIGGVAIGAFWPSGGPLEGGALREGLGDGGAGLRDASGGVGGAVEGGDARGAEVLGASAVPGEERGHLAPEQVLALFERVSKLKNETRKRLLAYRLASELGTEQIQEAVQLAKEDLEHGERIPMRALAQRWAELDPRGAAAKGLEMGVHSLFSTAVSAWAKKEPGAPLAWALAQPSEERVEALRLMLSEKILAQQDLEKLVLESARTGDGRLRDLMPFATMRLADSNPMGALHAASSLEDAATRTRTLTMVMGRVAAVDPELGRSWLRSQTAMPEEQRTVLERVLATPRTGTRRGP
ncbi:MAG: hypothetical protein RLZZ142_2305 [Verrucomicrobiota bacterium]